MVTLCCLASVNRGDSVSRGADVGVRGGLCDGADAALSVSVGVGTGVDVGADAAADVGADAAVDVGADAAVRAGVPVGPIAPALLAIGVPCRSNFELHSIAGIDPDTLQLGVRIERRRAHLTPDTALAEATERQCVAEHALVVDPHRPSAHAMEHAVRATQVLRPDTRRQAVTGAVRDLHRLILA